MTDYIDAQTAAWKAALTPDLRALAEKCKTAATFVAKATRTGNHGAVSMAVSEATHAIDHLLAAAEAKSRDDLASLTLEAGRTQELLRSALARAEKAEKDAGRYRWLMGHAWKYKASLNRDQSFRAIDFTFRMSCISSASFATMIDKDIDAAMSATPLPPPDFEFLARQPAWKRDIPLSHPAPEPSGEVQRLRAENFALAAGQCIVKGGLCGDDHGNQYCSLERAALAQSGAQGAVSAGLTDERMDEIAKPFWSFDHLTFDYKGYSRAIDRELRKGAAAPPPPSSTPAEGV